MTDASDKLFGRRELRRMAGLAVFILLVIMIYMGIAYSLWDQDWNRFTESIFVWALLGALLIAAAEVFYIAVLIYRGAHRSLRGDDA